MGQKGAEIVELDLQALLHDLNRAYCDEWLAFYSFSYMAGQVSGPGYRDTVEILQKLAAEKLRHIDALTARINELGGIPVARPDDLENSANGQYPSPPEDSTDHRNIFVAVKRSQAVLIQAYDRLAKKALGKDHVTYLVASRLLEEEVRAEEMIEAVDRQKVKV